MYDPFTGKYKITDNWLAHTKRGSLGGIDFAMPVGTPLPAIANGVLTNIPYNGTGGHTAVLETPLGKISYMHLSRFTSPRRVKQGDIIGYSGGLKGSDGAGSSNGPHLHIHATVNGKRTDYRTLVANFQQAMQDSKKIEPTISYEDETMIKLWRYTSPTPHQFIVIDHLNKKFRVIEAGSLEDAGIMNDVKAGVRRYDIIADPEWGENFSEFSRVW